MIENNIVEIIGKMERRSSAVTREFELAARRIAPIVERDSKRVMQEKIYDIPEKRSQSGRARWIRTVRLLQVERAYPVGVTVHMENPMGYAGARYHLGDPLNPTKAVSGHPREVRPPQMSVQWELEAALMDRSFILETRRRALLRALERP